MSVGVLLMNDYRFRDRVFSIEQKAQKFLSISHIKRKVGEEVKFEESKH